MTINPRILLSGASIIAATALGVGATFAFFSDTSTSTGNVLGAGTLNIDITDQNAETPYQSETVISNWAPGQDALVNFDVKNIGTLPVNLRGFATGTWGSAGLDSQNKVKVTKVERWNGSSWDTLLSNSLGITGLFYYSPLGDNASLFEVTAGSRAQLQLTVTFDSTAGDDFQGQTFTASLNAQAKQTNDNTSWP